MSGHARDNIFRQFSPLLNELSVRIKFGSDLRTLLIQPLKTDGKLSRHSGGICRAVIGGQLRYLIKQQKGGTLETR
jgi:hypothetical protein